MLTVLILAAGYGRRMGPFSRMVNKSLIPYNNKPLISHIIDKFNKNTKFIIACGHNGQQIKDYVSVVHDDKQIIYVDIPDFSEEKTGPATSIQHCEKYIDGPFFWLACDTLFDFNIEDNLNHNWIGVHPVNSEYAKDYCWVERQGESIAAIHNKVSSNMAVDAFIGLMYCVDKTYIENLKNCQAKEAYQGFDSNLKLQAHTVKSWKDFGTYDKWLELSKQFKEVSFTKPNELFYHDNNKIIKFNIDSTLTDQKANRALLNLSVMPDNIRRNGQFLVYNYVEGDIVYSQLTPNLLTDLLNWAKKDLWIQKFSDNIETKCRNFYFKKTTERLNQFRVKYKNWSEPRVVNGQTVHSIEHYLEKIDWDKLCNTSQWGFIHGDFQFENIIYNPQNKKFTCIDWRNDFSGDIYGDVYYDLGKMLGGILLNYQSVKNNELQYEEKADEVILNDCSINGSDIYVIMIKNFCIQNNLDWNKVRLLIPIIYLNMSPLHETPFDKYLFALAQLHFERYFNGY